MPKSTTCTPAGSSRSCSRLATSPPKPSSRSQMLPTAATRICFFASPSRASVLSRRASASVSVSGSSSTSPLLRVRRRTVPRPGPPCPGYTHLAARFGHRARSRRCRARPGSAPVSLPRPFSPVLAARRVGLSLFSAAFALVVLAHRRLLLSRSRRRDELDLAREEEVEAARLAHQLLHRVVCRSSRRGGRVVVVDVDPLERRRAAVEHPVVGVDPVGEAQHDLVAGPERDARRRPPRARSPALAGPGPSSAAARRAAAAPCRRMMSSGVAAARALDHVAHRRVACRDLARARRR